MVAMNGGFLTNLRALADPVERRWLIGRLRGRWSAPREKPRPAFLDSLPAAEPPGRIAWKDLPAGIARSCLLSLPGGKTLPLEPEQSWNGYRFDDPAIAAAFHGFSWLANDPQGIALVTLWPSWLEAFPAGTHPAWAPDITTERAIALLDTAARIGLPGPRRRTQEALVAHAVHLIDSLDDPDLMPSALLRRGHALARLGLELAMPGYAGFALALLTAETPRLLRRSGMSSFESTHHHLRLCQSLADIWLAARRHGRNEAPAIEALLRRALAVIPALCLGNDLPLVGDVAESLPPGWLSGLIRGNPMSEGWTGQLAAADRALLQGLRDDCFFTDLEALCAEGWLRVDIGGWKGLWHVAQHGWPALDSHGHQDLGATELYFGDVPVFVDPGGSLLGNLNGQALCRKASAHGGVQMDGRAPYPVDRPHYDDVFRQSVAGKPPVLAAEFDGASLTFGTLAGINGLREGVRRWHFVDGGLVIDDLLNGNGRYLLSRRLVTPLAVSREDERTVLLEGHGKRFRLIADVPLSTGEGVRWVGFGLTEPVHFIEINSRVNLPWRGELRLVPA